MAEMSRVSEADIYERLDRLHGAQMRDPYKRYAELRRLCPVQPGSPAELLEVRGADTKVYASVDGRRRPYTVLSFDAASQVLRDSEHFSSAGYAHTLTRSTGRAIIEMDGDEHRMYRAVAQQAFTRQAMLRWEVEIARLVHRKIDEFAGKGRAELVRELFLSIPNQVIGLVLGLPDEELQWLHERAVELILWDEDVDLALGAKEALGKRLMEVVVDRRHSRRDDFTSILVDAEIVDKVTGRRRKLDEEEILAFLRLLLQAGGETTFRLLGNLLFGLLTHPDQLEAVRTDRSLVAAAVDETLRWETSVQSILRTAVSDTTVAGIGVPAGSPVAVCLGAANHDETRWEGPDAFDILRPSKANLAFASGSHACLGMHLARMEAEVTLNALIDRCPNLRLDPDELDVHIRGITLRSPGWLPVIFDAS